MPAHDDRRDRQRDPVPARRRAAAPLERLPAPGPGAHRHPRRLRARRVRRLHRAARRRAGALLSDACGASGRRRAHDGRGPRAWRPGRAPPAPNRLPRSARAAVRLLHPRHPHDARRVPARPRSPRRSGDPRRARGWAAVPGGRVGGACGRPAPRLSPPPPIPGLESPAGTRVPLVKAKSRHVGEPIAMVVAESRYVAEDALADITIDVEPLEAVVDLEAALSRGAPLVHEQLKSNRAAHAIQKKGDYDAARATAHKVITRRFLDDRRISAAIENRAVAARWDARAEELTVWDKTQAPIPIRNGLAAMLGLLESQVRVIAPFVGGGFGPKIMMFYPEEVLVPWAAMRLGRPVKWTEDRQENFTATTQERGQGHDAELAVAKDGKILGVKDVFLHDSGAYDSYGLTVPINSQCTLLGPYDVPNYYSEFTAVFTNKTLVTPVRGAGRQHGVFVMERLLDFAARELGIDRLQIRRRHYLPSGAFPFNNQIIFQDSAPLVYDSGDYAPGLGEP